jgi:hypothetical protein
MSKRSSHKRKHHRRNGNGNGGGLSPLSPGSSPTPKSRKMKKKQRNYIDSEEFPLRFATSKHITKFSVLQERAREERAKLQQERDRQRALEIRVDYFINNTPLGRDKNKKTKKKPKY